MQVDPLATLYASHSGYNYALNDPVLMNDPAGAQAEQAPFCDYCLLALRVPSGRMGPGSGNFWTDGSAYSDWSANGGSQMYRDGLANGLTDIGGRLYSRTRSGYVQAEEKNGELLYWEDYTYDDISYYVNDKAQLIRSTKAGIGTRQVTAKGGPGDPKCPTCVDPSTVGNWFYTYGGPNNPLSYNGDYNYDLPPQNISDKQALIHDKDYDKKGAVGGLSLVLSFKVIKDDMKFVRHQLTIAGLYAAQFKPMGGGVMYVPWVDPVTNKPLSFDTAVNALIQGIGLGIVTAPKILAEGFFTHGPFK